MSYCTTVICGGKGATRHRGDVLVQAQRRQYRREPRRGRPLNKGREIRDIHSSAARVNAVMACTGLFMRRVWQQGNDAMRWERAGR